MSWDSNPSDALTSKPEWTKALRGSVASTDLEQGCHSWLSVSDSSNWLPETTSSRDVSALDPIAARRLWKLRTFQGEADIGYEKPDASAVSAVSIVLNAVCSFHSGIKSPAVSPSPDGDVLLSWRTKKAYLILQFVNGTEFEWAFKLRKPISGKADAINPDTQRGLVAILRYLLNPTSLPDVPRNPTLIGAATSTNMPPEQPRQLAISV